MKSKNLWFVLTLALVIALLSASAAPALAQGKGQETVRVWVQYKEGKKANVRKALQGANAHFYYTFDRLDSFVVSLPQSALNGIANNPNVADVEEDVYRYPVAVSGGTFINAVSDLAGPNGGTIPWGVDAVQARDVWDTNRDGTVDVGAPTGAGRKVCIIDTGYYQAHEDLGNADGGFSQVDDSWSRDGNGHGTHVAGTIAGLNNSVGVVGVSPGTVSLFIVKIFNDQGSWTLASDLVAAINTCADNGANVISMSLGGDRANGKENRAFQNLYNAGILSIAAAGNDGNTVYSYPASYDSVVSVAAVEESLAIADFSQQTDQVELSGPGVGVLSTVPYIDSTSLTVDGVGYDAGHIEFSGRSTASGALVDGGLCTSAGSWSGKVVLCQRGDISFYDKVMNVQNGGGVAAVIYNNAPGNFAGTLGDGNSSSIIGVSLSQADGQYLVANKLGATASVSSNYSWPDNGYAHFNGTSMATPHVAAVAALVWSANPAWTNAQIRAALQATALDLGPAGRDNAFGFGLVQAKAALDYLGGGTPVDNPPTVLISSPSNGASFNSDETVSFAGSASDDEDGSLTAGLVWTSSLDGQIGTGGSFSAVLSDGTHTITAAVTDSGGNTGDASVTVTVGGGGPGGGDLNVAVTTDKGTYSNRETVYITVTVTDGAGAPVSGATVSVSIKAPKSTLGATVTTGADGTATVTHKVNEKRDGSGAYTVEAAASKSGYTDGFSATTFKVQ